MPGRAETIERWPLSQGEIAAHLVDRIARPRRARLSALPTARSGRRQGRAGREPELGVLAFGRR